MEKKKEFQTQERGWMQYDPIVILLDIVKRWLVILLAAVVVGVGVYTVTSLSYEPEYRTSTTMVVTTRGSSSTVYSNQSSTATLASVFSEMVSSSVFRQIILEEAGISAFDGRITASQVSDTNLLSMNVYASDPRTAFLVTRAVLNNYEAVTEQVMGNVVLEVLQAPSVPMSPSNPQNFLSLAVKAALVTAVLACLLIGWLSFSRDTVRSAKEARRKLDCHYLGSIPHERKYRTLKSMILRPKTSVLITNPATSFQFSEMVRKLRSRVEQQMGSDKVLMVVSLLENEGKSTVSVNLALSMAKKYAKVLLIDCDLRKPACAKLLHVNWEGPGVGDILAGKSDPETLVMEDTRSNLQLLLNAEGVSDSGRLVSSRNLDKLLRWARENYDFVVLDLPPMSKVTDAERIMDVVDGSLLVVRQNAAPAKALNKTIASLSRGKAKMLGCVLNNVRSTGASSGQGQGNYYGRYGGYNRYGKYNRYGRYGGYGAYGSKDAGR